MEEQKDREELHQDFNGELHDKKSQEEVGQPVVPPEIPDELKVEEEWAERLGMDYDPQKAAPTPPPVYVTDEPYVPQIPEPERRPMPPTYMVWSIVSTILCCLPAGVVAIVFSSMVSSKYFARDYEGARKASRNAEIWIIVSIVIGVIVNAIYIPLSLMLP